MAGSNEPKNKKYAYLRQLSIDKLLELLSVAPVPASTPEDEAYVDALEEAIIEKENESPTGFLPDVNQQWAEFQKYYDVTEESPLPNIEAVIEDISDSNQNSGYLIYVDENMNYLSDKDTGISVDKAESVNELFAKLRPSIIDTFEHMKSQFGL